MQDELPYHINIDQKSNTKTKQNKRPMGPVSLTFFTFKNKTKKPPNKTKQEHVYRTKYQSITFTTCTIFTESKLQSINSYSNKIIV